MEEQIAKWKAEFGKIYRVRLMNQDYIFRPLLMSEYHTVAQQDDPVEKENIILSRGVLYPPIDLSTIPSGVAERLVIYISQATNITEDTIIQKVQEKRDLLGMTDDYLKWKCHLIRTLNYKPEEVDAMSLDKFINALVMAEEVLGAPLISIGTDEDELPQVRSNTEQAEEQEVEHIEHSVQADQSVQELKQIYAREKKKRVVNG